MAAVYSDPERIETKWQKVWEAEETFVVVNPEPRHEAWYDEMLVHGDTIVVVGYSYQASATEIGLFTVDATGRLAHTDTFFLRSNDYYSSRNYASRLLGEQLVFYMPYALPTADHPEG